MSETKFTKGEWQVWGDWAIKDCTSAENLIATFEDGNFDDAHLIAAAPDMYGVLNELSHTFEVLSNKIKVYEYDHEFKKIKAVLDDTLAKARGEK